jgi:hypothetical protein
VGQLVQQPRHCGGTGLAGVYWQKLPLPITQVSIVQSLLSSQSWFR